MYLFLFSSELKIDEIGKEVLPVIVSIRAVKNDKIEVKLQKITQMTYIPSIRLTVKKNWERDRVS